MNKSVEPNGAANDVEDPFLRRVCKVEYFGDRPEIMAVPNLDTRRISNHQHAAIKVSENNQEINEKTSPVRKDVPAGPSDGIGVGILQRRTGI